MGLEVDEDNLSITDIFSVGRRYLVQGQYQMAFWQAGGMTQVFMSRWISYLLFLIGGILPLYIISFILSSVWFIDIAKFGRWNV